LKSESKPEPLKCDTLNGLKAGTPVVHRAQVSYQKHGKIWFPKQANLNQMHMIDEQGQEHLVLAFQYEIKNFRLNHHIPDGKFVVEIPDSAEIRISDSGQTRRLSKGEFLELYGSEIIR
jgi:outer membrane lipoprotein-sorting protein